jgi:hypothetical protein
MGFRVKFDVLPEFVKPKLDGLDVETISLSDLLPTSTANIGSDLQRNKQGTASSEEDVQQTGSYDWRSWSLSLSLSNMESVVKVIETFLKNLDKVSQIITQVLKIIRLFSGNVKSIAMFLNFLIKKVAEELKSFLESFTSAGLYMSIISPNFDKKFPRFTIPVYGGFREFITRVNATCTSSSDPDAPKFNSPKDKVGGVIIGMLGGTNDPTFLSDLIDNFRVLSQFFGFQNPLPTPPKNFRAKAGFYRNRESGSKKMGVRLTWNTPDTPVTKYLVYRSTSLSGKLKKVTQDGVETTIKVVGEQITEIKNIFGKVSYRYDDFTVEDGKQYYYKIYSVMGDEFFETNPILEDVKSPIAAPLLTASPRNEIPLSELKKYTTLAINGELLSPFDFEGEWQSITVRKMVGSALDSLFTKIDALADKLTGLVDTGSNATTDYLKFYAKRVQTLLDVVTQFTEIIQRLMAFNLRGSFMLLRLPIEEGGMDNFLSRFNQASRIGSTKPEDHSVVHTAIDNPVVISKNDAIAQYSESGIMFGVILLFGFPEITTERLTEMVPLDEVDSLKEKLENTEKAITVLLKLLGLE